MDAMQQLYQQLILEHAKKPLGRVEPGGIGAPVIVVGQENAAASGAGRAENAKCCGVSHQVNPTCGDEITLRATVEDGRVVEVLWEGQGCSISQASASVMTELVTGEPQRTATELNGLFHELMKSRGKGLPEEQEELLGDAVAFTGVSHYPARIKCALLGWEALKDAMAKATSAMNGWSG